MRLLDAGATVDVDLFDIQVFWVAVDNLMTVSSVNLPGKTCQYTDQGCFFYWVRYHKSPIRNQNRK